MSAQPRSGEFPTVKVSTRFELDAGPARHRMGLIALAGRVRRFPAAGADR